MQGFKDSKGKLPLHTVFTKQFPKALIEIAKRSEYGHQKYIEHDKDYMNFKRIPNAKQEYANARMRHNMCLGEDSETYLDHLIAATWCGLAEIELILDKESEKEESYIRELPTRWDNSRNSGITLKPLPTTNPTKMTEENLRKCKLDLGNLNEISSKQNDVYLNDSMFKDCLLTNSDSTQKEELDENYDFVEKTNKIIKDWYEFTTNSKPVEIPFLEITNDEFIEKYKPHTMLNHGIWFYDTYNEASQKVDGDDKKIWSLVQCPYDEMFIYPGYHSCNNIGYVITEKEWEHENIQVDYNQNVPIETAISNAQMFILTRGYKLEIVKLISAIINIIDYCDKDKGYISIPRLYHATIDYIESITGEDLEENVLDEIRLYYYE